MTRKAGRDDAGVGVSVASPLGRIARAKQQRRRRPSKVMGTRRRSSVRLDSRTAPTTHRGRPQPAGAIQSPGRPSAAQGAEEFWTGAPMEDAGRPGEFMLSPPTPRCSSLPFPTKATPLSMTMTSVSLTQRQELLSSASPRAHHMATAVANQEIRTAMGIAWMEQRKTKPILPSVRRGPGSPTTSRHG